MSDRWVCKRCFANNEATAAACGRCGLTRGAEASAPDQEAWRQVTAANAAPSRWSGGLLRWWWVPIVVLVVGVGAVTAVRRSDDGTITSTGTLAVTELRVGDCFNAGMELEIAEVTATPCSEPHQYEIFGDVDLTDSAYPTDARFELIFEEECVTAFETYVGEPYATSALYASMFWPTASGWDMGDRRVNCVLFEPGDSLNGPPREITGSRRVAGG